MSLQAEWESAKPSLDSEWEAAAPKKQKKQPEDQGILSRAVAGATEPLLHLATGAVATPVAGLAGLISGLDPDVVRKVQNLLTYEPKTRGGQAATDVVTYPFRKMGEAADYVGGKTAEITGSPALGAAVNAGLQVVAPTVAAKGVAKLSGTPTVEPVVRAVEKTGDALAYVPGKLADVINNFTGPMRENWRNAQGKRWTRSQIGDTAIADVVDAITNPKEIIQGSPQTVADRIAGANVDSVAAQSGRVFGSPLVAIEEALSRQTGGISDLAKTIERRQQLGRQSTIDEIAGTAADYAKAIRDRKSVTDPMRTTELEAANTAGRLSPDLEAKIAQKGESNASASQNYGQMATEAAQAAERATNQYQPVPGYPNVPGRLGPNSEANVARSAENLAGAADAKTIAKQRLAERDFAQMQLNSLEQHGLKPLSSDGIVGDIGKKINERGMSTVARNTLRDVASDIAQWTKDGVIDSYELYRIRKEIGNKVEVHAKESGTWDKKLAAGVERDVQKVIDNAIEGAGGTGWKDYLKKYGEMSKTLDQMDVGQTLKEGLTGATGRERQLSFGNAVKKATETTNPKSGKPIIDSLTPEQQANVQKVRDEIVRDVMREDLGKSVKIDDLFEIADKGKGTVSIPAMLSRPATITNWIMKKIGKGADERIAQDMGRLMLEDPQVFAKKYIVETPQNPLIEAIMKRKLAAAGMVAGAQQGESP